MPEFTEDDVIELGEEIGLPVSRAEAAELSDLVAQKLEGIDGLEDLGVEAAEGDARDWRRLAAGENPNNAVIVECDVAPSGSGSLDGLDVGLKDNIAVAGVPMAVASEVMQGQIPATDAAVAERLLAAGARIAAKTNADEFGNAGHGTNGLRGPITNPHDPDYTAGGSSGGSAAAVASGTVDAALGSDTGGSIRIPASYCGLVGHKPTYGLVPLHGVVENTYTQDHVGPLAPTVEDAARVMEAIAGKDERDPASLQAAGRDGYRVGDYLDAATDPPDIEDLELGLVVESFEGPTVDEIETHTRATLDALADAGVRVREVSIPDYASAGAIKDGLTYTANADYWRAGGAPYRRGGIVEPGFQAALGHRSRSAGDQLNERIKSKMLAGAHIMREHRGRLYALAGTARERLREDFEGTLAGVDALVTPTMCTAPPRVEDAPPDFEYIYNTQPANVTRLPAVTLPAGTVGGLPYGLQLVGGAFEDAALLGIAASLEPELGA